jgi:hypothetical protein
LLPFRNGENSQQVCTYLPSKPRTERDRPAFPPMQNNLHEDSDPGYVWTKDMSLSAKMTIKKGREAYVPSRLHSTVYICTYVCIANLLHMHYTRSLLADRVPYLVNVTIALGAECCCLTHCLVVKVLLMSTLNGLCG